MFEKVNPSHPDKIADRIAGAMVDLAYSRSLRPKVAIEVLIGHGECNIIAETSEHFSDNDIRSIVDRIAGKGCNINYKEVAQDPHLASNQDGEIKCGDNGIFKGVPLSSQEKRLAILARRLYEKYPTDGKFIIASNANGGDDFTICQSNAKTANIKRYLDAMTYGIDGIKAINPLGEWSGGIDVDSGATNRKLGSDMGRAVTGGGLHGKDLSKADVSVNIYAHIVAQNSQREVQFNCAIGDTEVNGVKYSEIVEIARGYVESLGGFESLAKWGLI